MLDKEQWWHRITAWDARLEKILGYGASHALPIVLALFSIVAMLFWDSVNPPYSASALPFHVSQPGSPTSHDAVDTFRTGMNTEPVSVRFTLAPSGVRTVTELWSRHAVQARCEWTLAEKPEALPVTVAKHSYMAEIPAHEAAIPVACEMRFVGPATLKVLNWSESGFESSVRDFDRKAGLLDGGLLILAAFLFITALLNRDQLYAIFAVWMVINLRMAARSGGWDHQWLGHAIPMDVLLRARLVTTALYFWTTTALFLGLFREEMSAKRAKWVILPAKWAALPKLAYAVIGGYAAYLPVHWTVAVIGAIGPIWFLSRMLTTERLSVAHWYGASVAIALISGMSEVFHSWVGAESFVGLANSVTASLASGLLASLAVAQRMRETQAARIQVQERFARTFNQAPAGLFSLDSRGVFVSANRKLGELLGVDASKLLGTRWDEHFPTDSHWRLMHAAGVTGTGRLELVDCKLAGSTEVHSYDLLVARSQDVIEGSILDVTERLNANRHLEFLARHDALTGLLNRIGIDAEIQLALEGVRSGAEPLAVAYLDLDRFKLVNDLYGRGVGDSVLQHASKRVLNVLPNNASFARVGADQFVIVIPGLGIDWAAKICQEALRALGGRAFDVAEKAFFVKGSVGLVEASRDSVARDLLSMADRACQEAKLKSGNELVIYKSGSRNLEQYEAQMRLVAQLANPVDALGLSIVVQPIMSISEPYNSLNFEVLLRMTGEDGHLVRTDHLIAAAENCGRMGEIDRWVVGTTLAWIEQNQATLKRAKFICINLNGASLNDERFLDDMVKLLQKYSLVAPLLCFEITESVALHDMENTRRFISKVREFGVKVALDDFGAGYTSFTYLKELPADLLKIDGSFIVSMIRDPVNVSIVEAIVSLSNSLGMRTVAEWVEDIATLQALRDAGVDYVQGYVVAKPMPVADALGRESSADFVQELEVADAVAALAATPVVGLTLDLFEASTRGNNTPPKQ